MMKFPQYVSSGNRTVEIVGVIDKHTSKDKLVDGKGYVDENNSIWIYAKEKPHSPNEYPYFWLDGEEVTFSHPSKEVMEQFDAEKAIDFSVAHIIEETEPDEVLFNEKEIADINAAAEVYTPTINPKTDDFLKKVVKTLIIEKGVDISRLKNQTDEKYMIPNMKSALNKETKMSPYYFGLWMNLLGTDYILITKDNGEDKQTPLKHPIIYFSHKDAIGEIKGTEIIDTLTGQKMEVGTDAIV